MSLVLDLRRSSFDNEAVAYEDNSVLFLLCVSVFNEAYDLCIGGVGRKSSFSFGNIPSFAVYNDSALTLGSIWPSAGSGD